MPDDTKRDAELNVFCPAFSLGAGECECESGVEGEYGGVEFDPVAKGGSVRDPAGAFLL